MDSTLSVAFRGRCHTDLQQLLKFFVQKSSVYRIDFSLSSNFCLLLLNGFRKLFLRTTFATKLTWRNFLTTKKKYQKLPNPGLYHTIPSPNSFIEKPNAISWEEPNYSQESNSSQKLRYQKCFLCHYNFDMINNWEDYNNYFSCYILIDTFLMVIRPAQSCV